MSEEQIMKLCGESFNAGAAAAIESLSIAINKVIELRPEVTIEEILKMIEEIKLEHQNRSTE